MPREVLIADLTNPSTNPLPVQAQELVRYLLEGRVASLFLIAEVVEPDGKTDWIEGYSVDLDGNDTNRRAFAGAVDLLHRELADELQYDTVTIQIGIGSDDDDDEEQEEE